MKSAKHEKCEAPEGSPAVARRTAGGSAGFLTEMVDALVEKGGEGSAQLLGSDCLALKIRGVLSTQCPTIDAAIGRGGVPLGRLTIIHGPESSGKTTLALHLVAECQRRGGVALYIDKEYKLDPDYAQAIGVDTKSLVISQPAYLEKVFEICEAACNMAGRHREATGERVPILIILDSMNAAISKEMFQDGWDDQSMGSVARVYSQKLPKLMALISKEDVALVFISQVREKIGILYGNKETTAGGRAPKFYASLVMEVRRTGSIKEEKEDATGNKCEVYVGKNQIAPPFKRAAFDVVYGLGIDYTAALMSRAEALKIIERTGSWYSVDGEKIGNGLAAAKATLAKTPALLKAIEAKVREHDGGAP